MRTNHVVHRNQTQVSIDAIRVHILGAMLGHQAMYLENFTLISQAFRMGAGSLL